MQLPYRLFIFMLLFTIPSYSNSFYKDYSIYFFGLVQHFKPTSLTNEGNVNYIGLSKTIVSNLWEYENGVGTYVDSYNMRSYKIYTNISHKNYTYRIFKPLVGFVIHYKGENYTSSNRTIVLGPTLQLRIGEEKGIFTNILVVPKLSTLTNGFVAVEFGYKF